MIGKIQIVVIFSIFFLLNTVNVFAIKEIGTCFTKDPNGNCDAGLFCQKDLNDPSRGTCTRLIKEKGFCYTANPNGGCDTGLTCQKDLNDPSRGTCVNLVPELFGRIQLPDPLKALSGNDPTGTAGISSFLSNLIALIFSVAGMVLVFMFLWGAFEWLTSGGDKEKLSNAQKKIINAIIGIILFAVAFAILGVLGRFTGFTFFKRG